MGSTRFVLTRFANYEDKMTGFQMKDKIRQKYGVPLVDDLPYEFQTAHDKLYPVL